MHDHDGPARDGAEHDRANHGAVDYHVDHHHVIDIDHLDVASPAVPSERYSAVEVCRLNVPHWSATLVR